MTHYSKFVGILKNKRKLVISNTIRKKCDHY